MALCRFNSIGQAARTHAASNIFVYVFTILSVVRTFVRMQYIMHG